MYGDHRDLHVLTNSFPTRRSSDLDEQEERTGPARRGRVALRQRAQGLSARRRRHAQTFARGGGVLAAGHVLRVSVAAVGWPPGGAVRPPGAPFPRLGTDILADSLQERQRILLNSLQHSESNKQHFA